MLAPKGTSTSARASVEAALGLGGARGLKVRLTARVGAVVTPRARSLTDLRPQPSLIGAADPAVPSTLAQPPGQDRENLAE